MESYLAKTLTMMKQVQLVQEQGPKPRRWLIFCKKFKLVQMGLPARISPVLCTWFLKLHCGLRLIFLHFWDPYDVNFQVQALISNHAHMEDQRLFSNRPDWDQFCTVECLGVITPLRLCLTGGLYTSWTSPPLIKIQIIPIFPLVKPSPKTGSNSALEPCLMSRCPFTYTGGFPPLQLIWHVPQGWAHIPRH